MTVNLAAILYLIAVVCFIMALRGLSSPASARAGNIFGIAGMIIAVGTTLAQPGIEDYLWIVVGIVVGGLVGTVIALKIQMTAMPQLVAAFHSLVGLAAVLVAAIDEYRSKEFVWFACTSVVQAVGFAEEVALRAAGGSAFGAVARSWSRLRVTLRGSRERHSKAPQSNF